MDCEDDKNASNPQNEEHTVVADGSKNGSVEGEGDEGMKKELGEQGGNGEGEGEGEGGRGGEEEAVEELKFDRDDPDVFVINRDPRLFEHVLEYMKVSYYA